MKDGDLRDLLSVLGEAGLTPEEVLAELNRHFTADLGFARVDAGRGLVSPLPEVVLAPGKTSEETVEVMRTLLNRTGLAVATRLDPEQLRALKATFPSGRCNERGRVFTEGEYRGGAGADEGAVAIVSAGTSDLHAAEEAAAVLETLKVSIRRHYDVGVAGLHRLSRALPEIRNAEVCLVFAGMDAALPSILGGLYGGPLVAVPTSTGYGTAFRGVAALLSMLNACSPGICVMNIDNGLGAAAAALRILRGN